MYWTGVRWQMKELSADIKIIIIVINLTFTALAVMVHCDDNLVVNNSFC